MLVQDFYNKHNQILLNLPEGFRAVTEVSQHPNTGRNIMLISIEEFTHNKHLAPASCASSPTFHEIYWITMVSS